MNLFTIIPFLWARVVFKSYHCRTNLCFDDKFYCLKKSSYLTLLHKAKVWFFFLFFWRNCCHIWSLTISTHDTCMQNGYHTGNKVERWVLEVTLTESGCVRFILWREKMVSKVKVIFMGLEVEGVQVDRHKLQGHSETLYLISENIDGNCWKRAHGMVLETLRKDSFFTLGKEVKTWSFKDWELVLVQVHSQCLAHEWPPMFVEWIAEWSHLPTGMRSAWKWSRRYAKSNAKNEFLCGLPENTFQNWCKAKPSPEKALLVKITSPVKQFKGLSLSHAISPLIVMSLYVF